MDRSGGGNPIHQPSAPAAPAYRMGWPLYNPDLSFDAAEQILSEEWEKSKGSSKLPWMHARTAAKASWERIKKTQTKEL